MTYYRSVFTYAKAGAAAEQLLHVLQPEGLVRREGGAWSWKYFKTDHVGSTRVLLAARGSGLVAEQTTDFYPFGTAHGAFENLHLNRYLYGGKEYQDAAIMLGLYDFHARYYNPMYGRWFNQDPRLQTTNPYLYNANSPAMYVDPDGEFIFSLFNLVKDFVVNTFVKSWTQGLNAWTDGENWHSTTMAWKLDVGLFKGNFKQIISRFTWELPQTLAGYLGSHGMNIFGGVKSVSYYGGATVAQSYTSGWGALTLGSYIIGSRGISADPNNSLFQHEYGHYRQSQAAGPLYLAKYAIPSLYDATFGEKYTHKYHPTEQDANARALEYFEGKYPGFADARAENPKYRWDYNSNPIMGYDASLDGGYYNANNKAALKAAKIKAYSSPTDVFTSVFSFGILPVQSFLLALPYENQYRDAKKINMQIKNRITR